MKLLVRRVNGDSMLPTLKEGQIVVGWKQSSIKQSDIVILSHNGVEKIKRVKSLSSQGVYVVGDNEKQSTDSRQFGVLLPKAILAKIIWPL